MFTLTIVRHGETLQNSQHILQGQLNTELSEVGVLQAQLTGIRLRQECFTHVFSSDLTRAIKTCELILEKNTACHCTITPDIRLRERRFGVFEGRPTSEFKASVKEHHYGDGVETAEELCARAQEFYEDLCEQLIREMRREGGSLKRRHQTASLSSDVFPTSPSGLIDSKLSPTTTRDSGHSSSGSTSSGYDSLQSKSSCEQLSNKPADVTTVANTVKTQDSELASDISPSQESSCSSADDIGNLTDTAFCPTYDSDIPNSITPPVNINFGCPNVSLSPKFEASLSSMSSVSSGRNNSFDDADLLSPLYAKVLVVSHGGLIQKLILHFVENLGCLVPGGLRYASQTTPNTGISKFIVNLESDLKQNVQCLLLHDKQHLVSDSVKIPEQNNNPLPYSS